MKKVILLLSLVLFLNSCSDLDKKIVSSIFGGNNSEKIENKDNDINIKNINNNKVQEIDIKNENGTEEFKYEHNYLINHGWKVNNLGNNIKEYYYFYSYSKELGVPENGYFSLDTIYIQGNKILDFSIIFKTGLFLKINNSESDTINLEKYGILYDLNASVGQPIFGKVDNKIIITDLNTIKLVNKKKGINKVIWRR